MRSAVIVRNEKSCAQLAPHDCPNCNPLFFLLLHATELALKAIDLARNLQLKRTHDLVDLARAVFSATDRSFARKAYKDLRELHERRIRDRWRGQHGIFSQEALNIELQKMSQKPVGLASSFRTLGALGQSGLTKLEFGHEVKDWWHGARYPRFGSMRYPDFDSCVLICKNFLKLARLEMNNAGITQSEL